MDLAQLQNGFIVSVKTPFLVPDMKNDTICWCFLASTRYMVVKIACSCSEVVL
jgi:hypothetical protein